MVYTTYYNNLKNLPKNVYPVRICGRNPEGYTGFSYQKLAPKKKFFDEWTKNGDNEFYIKHFQKEVLNDLNQYEVLNEIYNNINFSEKDHIILKTTNCPLWENPYVHIALFCKEPPGEFCHRHQVAGWFISSGINVVEYNFL